MSIHGLIKKMAVHRKKIDSAHNRSRSLTTPIILTPSDSSPQLNSQKKTLLYTTSQKKQSSKAIGGVSTKKSKFLLKADEGERLNCLIKLYLNTIIVKEALSGDEDSYSVQISRGAL